MEPSEVLILDDLIQYQAGSIVSRTLLRKPAGNVTLFAFDAGESLSEHTTSHDALLVGIDGSGEITVKGETYKVGRGELILLPADEPHAVAAVERFKIFLIMIQ